MIRAIVLTVLLVCAVDARADAALLDVAHVAHVAPDSYTHVGTAGTGDASTHVARSDGHSHGWADAAAPIRAAPISAAPIRTTPIRTTPITTRSITLPAGALIEGESGLRIGTRGTTQLLRTPRDSGGARSQWAPQTVQPPSSIRHQPLFSLPSPLLVAGLQTWATATPPPFGHC